MLIFYLLRNLFPTFLYFIFSLEVHLKHFFWFYVPTEALKGKSQELCSCVKVSSSSFIFSCQLTCVHLVLGLLADAIGSFFSEWPSGL